MHKIILVACLLAAMASAQCSTYSYTSCSSCVNSGTCGWCSSTSTCASGSSSGPYSGTCSTLNWNYWSSDCTGGYTYSSAVGLGIGVIIAIIVIPILIIVGSIVACCVCCNRQPRSTVVIAGSPQGGYVQQQNQYPQQYPQQQQQYPQQQGYAPAPQQNVY